MSEQDFNSMEEYSIEWFKQLRKWNDKWLGTQAIKMLEHYDEAIKMIYDHVYDPDGPTHEELKEWLVDKIKLS